MSILLIIMGWLICGLVSVGSTFAYFQGEYPTLAKECYRHDLGFAIIMALIGGPCNLIVSLWGSGFMKHGWRLK